MYRVYINPLINPNLRIVQRERYRERERERERETERGLTERGGCRERALRETRESVERCERELGETRPERQAGRDENERR